MNPSPPDISIVIPVLNEAGSLPSTLEAIVSGAGDIECVVVDGGSRDNTEAVAKEAGCRVISAHRAHRALQLNLGAQAAYADILVFLHADTRLPGNGIDGILESLRNEKILGGGFVRVFDSDSTILKVTCALAAWRSRKLGVFLGDQGIFVRRETFEALGGFDETRRIAEDLDFSRRMRKMGPVTALEGPLVSSARRFEKKGPLLQSLTDLWLTVKYFAGS